MQLCSVYLVRGVVVVPLKTLLTASHDDALRPPRAAPLLPGSPGHTKAAPKWLRHLRPLDVRPAVASCLGRGPGEQVHHELRPHGPVSRSVMSANLERAPYRTARQQAPPCSSLLAARVVPGRERCEPSY